MDTPSDRPGDRSVVPRAGASSGSFVDSHDVVVLGAGPAGLGAAFRLAGDGYSVAVIEREPFVGGLASSFTVGGVRVDHGSHRLHPSVAPEILATLQALLGDDLQARPRRGRIAMSGRFVPFPPTASGLMRSLPPMLAARLLRDAVSAPLRRAQADSFAEVVRASMGPTLLREFYSPMIEKLFGIAPDLLAGELARRRVGTPSAAAYARRVLRPGPRSRGRMFFYPRRGYGQICEALADAASVGGARIDTNATVTRLEVGEDQTSVSLADGRRLAAGVVLSTLPLAALARLASGPRIDLSTRALTLVYLVLDRRQWTEFDAHYLPDARVPIVRISEPRNYRNSTDDPADRTVLCAEWPCARGDAVWEAQPRDLAEQIRAALASIGLAIPSPLDVEVRHVGNAYPVYDLEYASRFGSLDAWAQSLEPRVVSFGRQGLFAHDNAHHALAMGWRAAACVTRSGGFDRTAWASARHEFAHHVVED